jgi:outer membrane receptor protein involved in Fe transport
LNELFRPFRVGNNVTEANASLTPERLYGVEGAAGGGGARGSWSVTGFYNRLDNPVTNVTVAKGPFLDPVAGLIPAGGVLFQRRNVGSVEAYGVEAEVAKDLTGSIRAEGAVDWTRARVDGGTMAPQLNGLRPAGTPDVSASASLGWRPLRSVTLRADLRYQGLRFDDDQNTRRLEAATTVDLRAEWRPRPNLIMFVSAANVADVSVATGETADGVFSYAPPRTISVGFRVSVRGGR